MIDFSKFERELGQLPPGVAAQAQDMASRMQSEMFDAMKRASAGHTHYKEERFESSASAVQWLNENVKTVSPVAILPDFQSYSYVLIYTTSEE